MGMKLDEATLELRWLKEVNEEILKIDVKEIDVDGAWIKHWENVDKSLDTAIETMRKYQKIEKIVNADLEEYHPLDRDPYRLALIKKVIEDGKS